MTKKLTPGRAALDKYEQCEQDFDSQFLDWDAIAQAAIDAWLAQHTGSDQDEREHCEKAADDICFREHNPIVHQEIAIRMQAERAAVRAEYAELVKEAERVARVVDAADMLRAALARVKG